MIFYFLIVLQANLVDSFSFITLIGFIYNGALYLFKCSTIKSFGNKSLQKYALANGLPSIVFIKSYCVWNPIRWSNTNNWIPFLKYSYLVTPCIEAIGNNIANGLFNSYNLFITASLIENGGFDIIIS